MLKQPYIVIIFGPTAVGKTDVALAMAQRFPAEIINMDMGQFYTPLTIGTAKPAWQSEPVPHHLFDIINEPQDFTVNEYRARLQDLIHAIWARGRLPILVGGSGFYLKSLFFPPLMPSAPLPKVFEHLADGELWPTLYAIDPERANKIHAHDAYRIKRALAIWSATNQKPSEQKPFFEPVAPFHLVCLTRDRAQLYARINERVLQMVHAGWVDEVARLRNTPWEEFLHTKKIIGYDLLLAYLCDQSEEKLDEVIKIIQQKTRNYAKRQMTFWRMLERELQQAITLHEKSGTITSKVEAVDLTLYDLNLYLDQLYKQLLPLF